MIGGCKIGDCCGRVNLELLLLLISSWLAIGIIGSISLLLLISADEPVTFSFGCKLLWCTIMGVPTLEDDNEGGT